MKGAQRSETVKSRVPRIWFVWKIWDFLVTGGQKLGNRGHRALLEHSLENAEMIRRERKAPKQSDIYQNATAHNIEQRE